MWTACSFHCGPSYRKQAPALVEGQTKVPTPQPSHPENTHKEAVAISVTRMRMVWCENGLAVPSHLIWLCSGEMPYETWRMTRDFCTFDITSTAPVVTDVVPEHARCFQTTAYNMGRFALLNCLFLSFPPVMKQVNILGSKRVHKKNYSWVTMIMYWLAGGIFPPLGTAEG